MAKPFREWTVLPHGKLQHLEPNLRTVTGLIEMPPLGEVERRMTVVRLNDGGLVIFSAIALGEAEMKELEAFGRPAYLIVPNSIHRMDAYAWKQRYPSMQVIAPPAAREKVEEIVPVDATTIDFGDHAVRYLVVPGTDGREAALVVHSETGTTLVLNDLIFDLSNREGFVGWLFKVIGMTGDEPHIPAIIKMREVKDERALGEQLERWSHLPNLNRVIISHGKIISGNPAGVLHEIATKLAA